MTAPYRKDTGAPYTRAVAITPGAAIDATDGLLVGAAGTVICTMNGGDVTLTLPAGIAPISTTNVKAGGTATGVFALYR